MSGKKAGLIAAGIAGMIALGTGGYFANEWRVCRGLEQDYHNFAVGLISDHNLRATVNSPDLDALLDEKTDQAFERAGQTLFELGDRCGDRAAASAQAKAQALVLGIPAY